MSIFITDEKGNKYFNKSAYLNILMASPNALVVLDLNQKIIFVSERTLKFFRITNESEILGKDISVILHPSERQHAETTINKALVEGIIENEVFTFFSSSKELVYAEINASVVFDDYKKPEAIFVTARDITDRKKTEKELLFTRFVMDNSLNLTFWFDKNANIIYANKTARKLLGYSDEELSRLKVFDLDHSMNPEDWEELIFDLKLNGFDFYESQIFTKGGDSVPIEVTLNYFQFSGEELYCAFISNISMRRKAEREIVESEKHYTAIIEQSLAGFFMLDYSTKQIIFANKAFCDILGYSKHEITGLTIFDLLDSSDEITNQEFRNLHKAGIPDSSERIYRRKDGSVGTLIVNSNTLSYKGNLVVSAVAIDITKIKLMEKALKQSEEKFKLVADYTHDWEYWIGASGNLMYISPSCERTTGYTRDEFIFDNSLFEKIIHPEFKNVIHNHYIEEFGKEKPYNLNYKIITKYGEIRWINHACQPVFGELGEFLGRRVSNRDFTERKIAEDLLVESESRYRAVVEDQSELICRRDSKGLITFVNDAYCKYFNKKFNDLIGSDFFNYVHGKTRTLVSNTFEEVLKTKKSSSIEVQIFLDNGEARWTSWTIHPILDCKGNFTEFQSVGRDITEKKYAEEALESEKEHLWVTLRSIGDSVVTTDTDGKILLLSRAAEELFNTKQEKAKGKYFPDIFKAKYYNTRKTFYMDLIEDAIKNEKVIEARDSLTIESSTGEEIIVTLSAAPIRDKHHNIYGVVLVLKDITERIRNAETIVNSQKLESIGSLAAGIAHEFNNMLTSVLGNISLARTIINNDDDKISKRLIEAEKASLRAKDVAQQLITFAKGGAPIKSRIDIAECLNDMAIFIFNETKIKYFLDFEANLPLISADLNQFRQAISNILINSREAMTGEGELHVSAGLIKQADPSLPKTDAASDYIKIEIGDNGVGIKPEILGKVFDPYFSTKSNGRGLGLTSAYYIIKRHQGNLTITSAENEGTTITVYLPVK